MFACEIVATEWRPQSKGQIHTWNPYIWTWNVLTRHFVYESKIIPWTTVVFREWSLIGFHDLLCHINSPDTFPIKKRRGMFGEDLWVCVTSDYMPFRNTTKLFNSRHIGRSPGMKRLSPWLQYWPSNEIHNTQPLISTHSQFKLPNPLSWRCNFVRCFTGNKTSSPGPHALFHRFQQRFSLLSLLSLLAESKYGFSPKTVVLTPLLGCLYFPGMTRW